MAMVDEIERLGQQVEQDDMSREDAIQRLVEYTELGLTHRGAADLLGDWRNARRRYETAFGQR